MIVAQLVSPRHASNVIEDASFFREVIALPAAFVLVDVFMTVLCFGDVWIMNAVYVSGFWSNMQKRLHKNWIVFLTKSIDLPSFSGGDSRELLCG